jgi:hypothetical protein
MPRMAGTDGVISGLADQNCTANLLAHGAVFSRARSERAVVIIRHRDRHGAADTAATRHHDGPFTKFSDGSDANSPAQAAATSKIHLRLILEFLNLFLVALDIV